MKIKVSKEAARELEEAAIWYESEQASLGSRFLDAFDDAIQLLKESNPPLTPIDGEAHSLGGKKLILHKFPFSLITIEKNSIIILVALAHHSRKPGYWADRINS